MRVLVCGSRDWYDIDAIDDVLRQFPLHSTTVIAGAARGADRLAATVATRIGMNLIEVPANWDKYGRRAGFIRNIQMLDMLPDIVIAFWDGESRGTMHTVREARKRGIEVRVYTQ